MGCDDEGPQELEQVTGLALSLASLPGVEVSLKALDDDNLPDAGVYRQDLRHLRLAQSCRPRSFGLHGGLQLILPFLCSMSVLLICRQKGGSATHPDSQISGLQMRLLQSGNP